jgi:hypothetical protein
MDTQTGAPANAPRGQNVRRVKLAAIRFNKSAWPRECLDDERVEDFTELYREQGVEALPALELVPDGGAGYLIGDGVHRWMAAREAGLDEVSAVLVVPPNDIDPAAFAYLHALYCSAISSKPLTRSEKQAAIRCLMTNWPEMSDREVARRVGVDHKTVGRVRRGDSPAERDSGYSPGPSPENIAKRLFKAFEKAYEARGLGIADFFAGDRTGERLAVVFDDVYGERALERAQMFRSWIEQAISALESGA